MILRVNHKKCSTLASLVGMYIVFALLLSVVYNGATWQTHLSFQKYYNLFYIALFYIHFLVTILFNGVSKACFIIHYFKHIKTNS